MWYKICIVIFEVDKECIARSEKAITAAEEDDEHIKIPSKDIAKRIAGFLTRGKVFNSKINYICSTL